MADRTTDLKIKTNIKNIVKEIKADQKILIRAERIATNQTLGKMKVGGKKEATGIWVVKGKDISAKAKVVRKTATNKEGKLVYAAARVGATHAKLKPGINAKRKPKQGYLLEVKRGKPFKVKIGFAMSPTGSSKRILMQRQGKSRLPIERVTIPSIAQMMSNKTVSDKIAETSAKEYNPQLARQLRRLLP